MPLTSVRTPIDPLECQANVKTRKGRSPHYATIARFLEFLATHPNRPLCLTEICEAIGVAERALRSACEEHLGMGPIRYILCVEWTKCTALYCAQMPQIRQLRASLWTTVFASLAAFLLLTAFSSASRLQRPCGVRASTMSGSSLTVDMVDGCRISSLRGPLVDSIGFQERTALPANASYRD